jgi:hypothetical protein
MPVVRYAHHLDLVGNEIRNARVHNVTGLPTPIPERIGWIVYNTVDGRLYYCTGSAWELRATNSDALGGQAPAFYLDRANHTGTQSAATITGLTSAIQAVPLNEMATPTGPLDLGNQELTNAAPATATTSVPTWGQVADLVANLGFKHVRLASTANVNITTTGNGGSIDGTTLVTGDLVLLKDQTNPVQNGIYRVGALNMGRDANNDTAQEMPSGTVVVIDQGDTNAESMFMLTTSSGFVVGSDPLTFSPFGVAPNPYIAGDGISIVTNTISAVAGSGITVGPGGIAIDGTVVARHYEVTVPVPGSGTAVNLLHNLGRSPVPVACMEIATKDKVEIGVNYPDDNNVIVDFAVAPTTSQYRVSVG